MTDEEILFATELNNAKKEQERLVSISSIVPVELIEKQKHLAERISQYKKALSCIDESHSRESRSDITSSDS